MKIVATLVMVCLLPFSSMASPVFLVHPPPSADTVFLRKVILDTVYSGQPYHFYNNVYIDTNHNSKHHDQLVDFAFTATQNLDKYNDKMNRRGLQMKHIDLQGLPQDWVPLYLYKDHYYVYQPSEPGALLRRILSDSLLICWFIEGPVPFPVQSVAKKDASSWSLITNDIFVKVEGFIRPETLNIYLIDPRTQISVWEYRAANEKEWHYELRIPKEHIHDFPIVVNESNEKAPEFDFDEPDFKKLIRSRPRK